MSVYGSTMRTLGSFSRRVKSFWWAAGDHRMVRKMWKCGPAPMSPARVAWMRRRASSVWSGFGMSAPIVRKGVGVPGTRPE